MLFFKAPSGITVVDDNEGFLESIQLVWRARSALRTFSDLDAAAAHLQASTDFLRKQYADLAQIMELRDRASAIEAAKGLLGDPDRGKFSDVVFADLNMPQMDGISFLKGTPEPLVRKVLMTGAERSEVLVTLNYDALISSVLEKKGSGLIQRIQAASQGSTDPRSELVASHLSSLFVRVCGQLEDTIGLALSTAAVEDYVALPTNDGLLCRARGGDFLFLNIASSGNIVVGPMSSIT